MNDRLFNCCTDHTEPDWTQFDALELHGCVNVADGLGGPTTGESETYIESGYSRAEAELFTISGHLKEGGAEAITDCLTFEDAQAVAAELASRSGLTVSIYC